MHEMYEASRTPGGTCKGEIFPVLNKLSTARLRRLEEWMYRSTTSTLDESDWSASRPGRFTRGWKGPRYPLDRRLGEPHNRSGRYGEQRNVYHKLRTAVL
jgi:hypothetical protein